jgi:hypothetical protein
VLSAAALATLHGVALAQRLLGVQAAPRRLTADETALLSSVCGDSLELEAIRVSEGRLGVLGLSGRPFTAGHLILVPRGSGEDSIYPGTLVHEAIHVWQFEHGGPQYVLRSLWAQLTGGIGTLSAARGYDFDNALRRGTPWTAWNPEQQAELFEHAYEVAGVDFRDPSAGHVIIGGVEYIGELVAALAALRAARLA